MENVQSASLPIPELMDYEEADQHTEIIHHQKEAEEIPAQVSTPRKMVRYPGDVLWSDKIVNMSPQSIAKSIRILKNACDKKNKTIKRLYTQTHRQKKKIKNISSLLMELRQKCLLSSNSGDVLQVLENIFKHSAENINIYINLYF